jgi:hypothetical protein
MIKIALIRIFVLSILITSAFSKVYDAKCAGFYFELHPAPGK